jgi:hypothetical protein
MLSSDNELLAKIFRLFESSSDDIVELSEMAGIDITTDLSASDLSGTSFADKCLIGCDLSRSILAGCRFDRADLFCADFSFATIDFDELRGANRFDCAIWPNPIYAQLDEGLDRAIQRALRIAKELHNLFALPYRVTFDRVYEAIGDGDSPRMEIAKLLDTVGRQLDPTLYVYFEYLLNWPLHYKENSDVSGIDTDPRALSEIEDQAKHDILWVVRNRLTEEAVYSNLPPPLDYDQLGSWFWREWLAYALTHFHFELVHGKLHEARHLLGRMQALAGRRHSTWWAARCLVEESVLDLVEGLHSSKQLSIRLGGLRPRVAPQIFSELVGAAVWSLYLASIYRNSAQFRRDTLEVVGEFRDDFWGNQTFLDRAAVTLLEPEPGFWLLSREGPQAAP